MKAEFNLDDACAAAQKRVAQYVNRSAAQHLRQMREESQRAQQQKAPAASFGGMRCDRKYAPQHLLA